MSRIGKILGTLAVVMLTTAGSLYGSITPQGIFTEYTAIDGMAHNNIHEIYTDSQGYVWLCTWSGVSRFDGYTFKNYCTDPKNMPVRNNRFRSVDEDKAGNLWFRTYDDHIYRFNRLTEEFEDVCEGIEQLEGRLFRTDNMLCTRQSDKVWIEYQGFGLVGYTTGEGNRLEHTNYIGNTLIGSSISHMATDREGNLWVCSEQGNLAIVTHEGEVVKEVARMGAPIVDLVVADELVFYATDNIIGAASVANQVAVSRERFGHDTITALSWDANKGTLYIGTLHNGLYTFAPSTSQIDHIRGAGKPTRVRDMVVDSHGTVWITDTREGITRYDARRGNYKHFSQERNTVKYYSDTTSMVVEHGEGLWVKMNHVGFGYYDRQSDRLLPFYNDLASSDCRMTNGVATFEIDDDDVMWLSTYYERGLKRIVLQQPDGSHKPLGDADQDTYTDEVRALAKDHNGSMWVGTKEGKLYCYNTKDELVASYDRLPQGGAMGPIYTITEDSQGNIWVGTKGDGVYRMSPRTGSKGGYDFKHFVHSEHDPYSLSNDQVYCIAEDHDGRIWFATFGGAINMLSDSHSTKFYNTNWSFGSYPSQSGARARYLLVDGPDRLLIGTSDGLLVCNPQEAPELMTFKVAQREAGNQQALLANDVIHILKDSAQRVWLSTYGGGLSRIVGYDQSGVPQMENYTVSDGLASNIIMATTEDNEGSLWLTTESGLTQLDTKQGIFTNYSRYDSFRPTLYNEAAAITNSRGELVVGSNNGIEVINPKQMSQSDHNYKLRITAFEVQNSQAVEDGRIVLDDSESANTLSPITLRHNYLLMRIEFAALNFRLQGRVNYMYKLEGYDSDWTDSRSINSVYYSKVPHGHYTFRVKAYVGNPQMASEEISLPIHIVTPPWASWWAWMLYVVFALALLWFVTSTYARMARIRANAKIEQDTAEMKLKFFTNISHELRTPLTLIMGGIEEVQRRETLSERGESSLNLSYKNSKRMLSLINQILDFRKVVKNKMELRVSRIDIVEVARGVLEDFRDLAQERNIELIFSLSRNHIPLWADPQRIESLLYNLLSNAMKFTRDKGTIELAVALHEERGEVTITVKDNGIGIPKERIGEIFERFAQYSAAVKGGSGSSGSGIGLALSKEIVELHKGHIEVESKVGKGSTFTIHLLLGNSHFSMEQIDFQSAGQVGADKPQSERRAAVVNRPKDAKKILLVEDNSEVRAFIYNNLIDTYEVIEAADGVEALERLKEDMPDVVVTDIMMPRMDGIELVDHIRKDFELSHLPVIMLTAKQTPADSILAMKYGADAYITKPFSMEFLQARIDNLLSQRSMLFDKIQTLTAGNRTATTGQVHPKDVVVTNRDEEFLHELMEWIEANIENSDLTIDNLATHLRLGRTTMYNKIKSLTGKSPVELIKEYRVTKSEMLLRTGQFSVSEVAYKVGFSDPGYFSRCFKEQYKSSPVEYLKKLNIKQS